MHKRCKDYGRAGDFSPTRHRKVNGYTMSNRTTKTLPSLMSCFVVIFTDSFNSNMGYLREGAAVDAPTTAVRRALVDRNEVFSRFTSGNGFPLLPAVREVANLTRNTCCTLAKVFLARRTNPLTSSSMAFQFFMHNV